MANYQVGKDLFGMSIMASDCASYLGWLGYPVCWNESVDAWKAKVALPNPPMPPVVRSSLPNGQPIPIVPASGAAANQTITAIVTQQGEDWQTGNEEFFRTGDFSSIEDLGLEWYMVAAIGLGIIGAVSFLRGK